MRMNQGKRPSLRHGRDVHRLRRRPRNGGRNRSGREALPVDGPVGQADEPVAELLVPLADRVRPPRAPEDDRVLGRERVPEVARDAFALRFGRAPVEEFFAREPGRVYLEEAYRGCAILLDAPLGAYLTKFAVSAEAQGEGIARDLWDALAADAPAVFWRARPANPITGWYVKLCDGLVRLPDWTVYWKGLAPDAIPGAIEWALRQPVDIPRNGG